MLPVLNLGVIFPTGIRGKTITLAMQHAVSLVGV